MIDFTKPHRMIELEHGDLAYWVFGQGPDVVFVHGWPLHAATWRRILAPLAAHYRCHVFDLPGARHSRWADDGPFGLWEHARTLKAAMDQLDLDAYALVAHDSGGTIARLLATLTPGRVTAIVMGNTEVPGHALPGLQAAKLGVSLPGVVSLMKLLTSSKFMQRRMFEGCFADVAEIETDFGALFIEPLTRDDDYVRGQLRLLKHIDWRVVTEELAAVHREITAPVLLVWGDRDPWFPWRLAREMVDSFAGPAAQVHLIEGGKLFVHEEFAEEFANATLKFLDRTHDPALQATG